MTTFEENITAIYGAKGQQWLTNLPHLVARLASTWRLTHLQPFENLTYNHVLQGIQGALPIVLKLSLDPTSLHQEIAALQAFSGFGAVDVVVQSEGALLLSRACPGKSLKQSFPIHDIRTTHVALDVMMRLHQAPLPDTSHFLSIAGRLAALDQDVAISKPFLIKARTLRDQLLATATKPVLLHGDLHHDNILSHKGGWIAIDPKGVVGESAYEVATFVHNPIPELLHETDVRPLIAERIKVFSHALCIDESRLYQWCFVQAVLAWVWAIEDGTDPSYFQNITRLFDRTI